MARLTIPGVHSELSGQQARPLNKAQHFPALRADHCFAGHGYVEAGQEMKEGQRKEEGAADLQSLGSTLHL